MADIVSNPEANFEALIPDRDALLQDLEAEAAAEEIPIVGPVVGELLFVLVRATQAQHILELGAATGYSAIYLGRACEPAGGRVMTFEYDPAMAARARENISQAGLSSTVSVRDGNALTQLGELSGPFDFVFICVPQLRLYFLYFFVSFLELILPVFYICIILVLIFLETSQNFRELVLQGGVTFYELFL